jgi:hypothetical protein
MASVGHALVRVLTLTTICQGFEIPRDCMNSTAIPEQVVSVRNRSNFLLYDARDEPDGSKDPRSAAAVINFLDPYRPSSLVLNCQDYFFTDYAAGTPVLMQYMYPIGINATSSVRWHTPARLSKETGCDNCVGGFVDIQNCMLHDSRYSAGGAPRRCGLCRRALGLLSAQILCQHSIQTRDTDCDCVRDSNRY